MKQLLISIVLVLLNFNYVIADDSNDYFNELKKSRIDRAKSKLIKIENEINLIKEKIDNEKDKPLKIKLIEELTKSEKMLQEAEIAFISMATDLNLDDSFKEKEAAKFSIIDELINLAKPIIDSLKRVSQRPRKIETLKTEIEGLEEKNELISIALQKLEMEKEKAKIESTKELISRTIKRVKSYSDENQLKLDDAKIKLHKLMGQEGTLMTEVKGMFIKFTKTKGKNILISIIVFCLIFFTLRKWRLSILNIMNKILHKYYSGRVHEVEWVMRPVSVLYSTLIFLIASGISFFTLYLLNDWILVTSFLLVNGIIIWSLKDKIPTYIEQFKLILNFGPIRENERIVWKGIPWKVKSLGFFCILENPTLENAVVRVHSSHLLSLQSRPLNKVEPWFPTQLTDWVELSDGVFGQVIHQTQEQVQIKLIGGAIKTYETLNFLAQNPVNLSHGFMITSEFGFDYAIQKDINTKIKLSLEQFLIAELTKKLENYKLVIKKLSIEFDQAASSSLNFRVMLEINGEYASEKLKIHRLLNSLFVDFCNINHFTIPFNQLSVHFENQALLRS